MEQELNDLSLIALSLNDGFSWARTRRLIEELGSPRSVLDAGEADQLLPSSHDELLAVARQHVDDCQAQGIMVSSLWGEGYPPTLRAVHDAPPVVYWRGYLSADDVRAVAIVGTRQPDDVGTKFARALARTLADEAIPVVSGLARGIDAAAMRESLSAGGRTIGVMGTGHGRYYPSEHRDLHDAAARYLLLSQFRPGASASRRTFPMRNVVMSGFSSVTVIVQAGESSGTKIQANAAVRHGKPLVISDRVVASSQWAQGLIDTGYEVEVVHDAAAAFEAVNRIHSRSATQEHDLGALLSL